VVVIGEAPGAEEDRAGQPFVGKAGRMLDRMLEAIGLADQVFITNTVFWRPPGNRTPTPEEQRVCKPFVEQAIRLVRPRMLLLVGAPATRCMLDQTDGINRLHGRWFEWRTTEADLEVPALPTFHPAFLMRTPSAKSMAWSDLKTFAERLNRPSRG
jgi:DNA polymerase